jgi:hypothetical protein
MISGDGDRFYLLEIVARREAPQCANKSPCVTAWAALSAGSSKVLAVATAFEVRSTPSRQ